MKKPKEVDSISTYIRIAGVTQDSVVDGPGCRYVVFTQGCPHQCKGCHNPETHSTTGGKVVEVNDLVKEFNANPLTAGVTLSGGEPFMQPVACLALALAAHDAGLNVWIYTGYTWEELMDEGDIMQLILLQEADVLVDGRFEEGLKNEDLYYRGSCNQRLVDVQKSMKSGRAVLWQEPESTMF